MPALMGDSNAAQNLKSTKSYEMDKLVEEVRERLCLRGREKLNAVRRSTPYSRNNYGFVDTRENGEPLHRFSQRARPDCYGARCSQCSWKMTRCKCSGRSSDLKNEAPNLLKQLLAERRLIQEAVRRIHLFEHSDSDDPVVGGPTMCVSSSTDIGQSCSSPCSARSISTDSVGSSTFSSTSDVSGTVL